MNIVKATGVFGQIKNAIQSAEEAIARIELTQEEMDEFMSTPEFSMYTIDKHYGGNEIQVPLAIKNHHRSDKVKSCWFMQTLIIVS